MRARAAPPAPHPLQQQARTRRQAPPRRPRRAATRGLATSSSSSSSSSSSRAAGGEGRARTGGGASAPSHATHSSATAAFTLTAGHSGGSSREAAAAERVGNPKEAGGSPTGVARHAASGWRQVAGSCDGSTARPKRQRRARPRVCPRRGGGAAAARYETGTGTPPTHRPRSTASRVGRQRVRASGAPASAQHAKGWMLPFMSSGCNPTHPSSPMRAYSSRTCPLTTANVPSTWSVSLCCATEAESTYSCQPVEHTSAGAASGDREAPRRVERTTGLSWPPG